MRPILALLCLPALMAAPLAWKASQLAVEYRFQANLKTEPPRFRGTFLLRNQGRDPIPGHGWSLHFNQCSESRVDGTSRAGQDLPLSWRPVSCIQPPTEGPAMPDIVASEIFESQERPRQPWDVDPELRQRLIPKGEDPYQPDPYA